MEEPSRYYTSPHDSSRDASPHSHLLSPSNTSSHINNDNTPHYPRRTYALTLNPVLALRILSSLLSLTAFIILALDCGDAFIAADIFLMAIIILNVLLSTHHLFSNVVRVTVELRRQRLHVGSEEGERFKVSTYFDVGLSATLLVCLLVGNAACSRYWAKAWKAAVIVGYFVVLIQVALAVPALYQKSLTLTATLSDLKGKVPANTKVAHTVDNSERGTARRRNADVEETRQTAEDLV